MLIGSLGFGSLRCKYTDLPVVLSAQFFSHSDFIFSFIICLQVLRETAVCGCSSFAPSLANKSAASFPGISQWLGIHCRVISTEKVVMMSLIELLSFSIIGWQLFLFSRACKTDLASVKITMLLHGLLVERNVLFVSCRAL